MFDVVLTLSVATVAGFAALLARFPPLVGFLAAGFFLGGFSVDPFPGLEEIADIGVTLLLFTIGLKLDIRALTRREAWGSATVHMAVFALVTAGFISLLGVLGFGALGGDWRSIALISFALSFSSTVLCIKVLESRSDDGSYYGQTAISILVMQDLFAVVFITATGEEPPSVWALAILVCLVPASWLLGVILDRVGHGEVLVLFGVALALGPGYYLFDLVGLKGDLGALIMGVLLARHPRSQELASSLFSMKELFLVGFFLTIGMGTQPSWSDVGFALVLCVVLIPIKTFGFFSLGRLFGMRNRTAGIG